MEKAVFFFFDSYGSLWATDDGEHPEARAFGPTGTARPAVLEEMGMDTPQEGTDYNEALAAGRVDHGGEGDFPVILPT